MSEGKTKKGTSKTTEPQPPGDWLILKGPMIQPNGEIYMDAVALFDLSEEEAKATLFGRKAVVCRKFVFPEVLKMARQLIPK